MRKDNLKILGIIPARSGSKKVPQKNIKPLAGKPLIAYTIEESKKSRLLTRTLVSTNDEDIARIAKSFGADVPFMRPQELADDYVTDLPVFQHCLSWLKENDSYEPDVIVHLRPTAPLRRAEHIDAGIELLLNCRGADSVRSVTLAGGHPLKMWKVSDKKLMPFTSEEVSGIRESYNMPRQKLPEAYIQNGSVDVIWAETLLKKNSMSGDRIIPFIMEEPESVNIDSEVDFLIAEALLMKRLK